MWLKNISLLNFKNYSDADLSFSNSVNVFVGPNGAGKTNILDAIHYLSLCKSFYNPIDSQQIKSGTEMFLIQGVFDKNGKNEQISCGLKKNQKKQFKKNKKEYAKLADHIGLFPLVMSSPYDSNLILEGSEERRKFIDNVISQTNASYLETLIQYNKYLFNRNALLKQMAASRTLDITLVQIYNEQLVDAGNKIFAIRKQFMADFIPYFNKHYSYLTENKEQVALTYLSQLNHSGFDQLLEDSFEKDRILERTNTGIHKDDMGFMLQDMPIKKFGSQGQQKSFLIALKLAQYSYLQQIKGFKPLLLLDDIFDKLDDLRIHKLLEMVSHQDFGQIFISDTGKNRIESIFQSIGVPIQLFEVEGGAIKNA